MYIDIFKISSEYRGIGRAKNFLPMLKNQLANEYFSLLDEDAHIHLTSQNHYILRTLLNSIVHQDRKEYDIIAFGNSDMSKLDEYFFNAKFLGYDITGDSYNESPIFRAVFDNSNNIHSVISNYLNEYGLCNSISDCYKIIKYINDNNDNFF